MKDITVDGMDAITGVTFKIGNSTISSTKFTYTINGNTIKLKGCSANKSYHGQTTQMTLRDAEDHTVVVSFVLHFIPYLTSDYSSVIAGTSITLAFGCPDGQQITTTSVPEGLSVSFNEDYSEVVLTAAQDCAVGRGIIYLKDSRNNYIQLRYEVLASA